MPSSKLPPLPVGHARVMAMLSDDDVELWDVSEVVDTDPALTASMLQAANSARSAPIRRIGDAHTAIVRLGIFETRRILAGTVLGQTFRGLQSAGLDVDELWRHVVTCALLAEVAVDDWARRSEAFTAGLLHDIGRLAMAAESPHLYARVVALVETGDDPMEAERRIYGWDHAEWGADVGEAFRLPADVIEAASDHHQDAGAELSRCVYQARRLCWLLGTGDGLIAPEAPDIEESHEDWAPVHAMGGFEVLRTRIDWYQRAIRSAA